MKSIIAPITATAACVGLVLLSSLTANAQTYQLKVVNPPPGWSITPVFPKLGDLGHVAGLCYAKIGKGKNQTIVNQAFLWDDDGITIYELPALSGEPYGLPLAMSDAGVVVGYSGDNAILWMKGVDGSYDVIDLNELLPLDFGWHLGRANAISPDGRFVAVSATRPEESLNGKVLLEIDSSGSLVSAALVGYGVGNQWTGIVGIGALRVDDGVLKMTGNVGTGYAYLWAGPASPFVFESGAFFNLHPANLPSGTHGVAINAFNQVAGEYSSRAVYWDEYGQMADLFNGQELIEARTFGINEDGFVVGSVLGSPAPNQSRHFAFRWHPTTGPEYLTNLKSPSDTSGVTALDYAVGINNAGQILATGATKRQSVWVLMNPE